MDIFTQEFTSSDLYGGGLLKIQHCLDEKPEFLLNWVYVYDGFGMLIQDKLNILGIFDDSGLLGENFSCRQEMDRNAFVIDFSQYQIFGAWTVVVRKVS